MLSRAWQEHYPMGSVIKVIGAVAGLYAGVATPSTVHTCEGTMLFEGREYRCTGTHGDMSLQNAIAHSCNIYFYKNALATGTDMLLDTCRAFGLGEATGIDLPAEAGGVFPMRFDDGAYRISNKELLFLSIGQGPVAATPLQVARACAGIASRGRLPRPFVGAHRAPVFRQIPAISPDIYAAVEKGMTAAVHVPGGTAYEAFNERKTGAGGDVSARQTFCSEFPYILVAAKTGTAEHGMKRAGYVLSHSWIAGYAPVGAPEIAFAVIVESAGHGGGAAAMAAAEMLAGYFRYTRKGAAE
jgi:penicillin-binding protein 2